MENTDNYLQNMVLELRRGAIVISVLSQLDQEQYGYSLLKLLANLGMEIEQGTLYPLLRRLETQGLVQSNWRIVDEARPRRYYQLSARGRQVLVRLKKEWSGLVATMNGMLK
jgi:DNA-binding PadR family transcriptional regulator